MQADRHWLERARCLAVMERRPDTCMAPAPSTNWHMRELNTCTFLDESVQASFQFAKHDCSQVACA